MHRQSFSYITTSNGHTAVHTSNLFASSHSLTLVTARSSALRSPFVHALPRFLLLAPLLVPEVVRVTPPPKVCTADATEAPSKGLPKRGRSLLGAYQYQSAGGAAGMGCREKGCVRELFPVLDLGVSAVYHTHRVLGMDDMRAPGFLISLEAFRL